LLDLPALLGKPQRKTAVYSCGPEPLLAAVEAGCEKWPSGSLHLERFAPKQDATAGPQSGFEVELAQSGRKRLVSEDMSVLEAVESPGRRPSEALTSWSGAVTPARSEGRPGRRAVPGR
jgi:ferredoxin-NADP reductase